ncbi:MAG: ATP:cob(I)alamin adenosyltransferase, partial [Negativicoccus succinicivorans]|nr:ATP:cob(I)alamin adenosyltransferase [Negativicoccus succinicivorans]
MAKVYTKTGDKGTTALYTGQRLPKYSTRVETYGIIDEAQAVLGMARAAAQLQEVKDDIYSLQKDLWILMADTASLGKDPD